MNLIFDSGETWGYIFLKKQNFKKGGAKGGQGCIFEMAWWLCKKIRISSQKLVLELRIMVYLVGTNIRERCPPFLCSTGCPPFHIRAPRIENAEFSTFLRLDTLFMSAYRGLPPPFFSNLKSSKGPLQILHLSFFVKMLCFSCTDPCPKNELAILLCKRYFFWINYLHTTYF